MDELIRMGVNPAELGKLNACRVYLQAYYLSDITTGDRQYLDKGAYDDTE